MDSLRHKLAKLKWVIVAVIAISGLGSGAYFWKKKHADPGHAVEKNKESKHVVTHSDSIFKSSAEFFTGINTKVQTLKESEHDNEQLKLENANLRLQLQSVRQECIQDSAKKTTITLSEKVEEQTGSRVGRSLASINYKAPTHLLPSQLYSLGVTYFKGREDEKAAVIFTLLTGMEESDQYRTAKDLLMTGVAWYRIDNFELADKYFESSIATKELEDNLPYQAQARLWRGLVAQKLGKTAAAQQWLRELLDYHPHSVEAEWINQGDGEKNAIKNEGGPVSDKELRQPASSKDEHGEHEKPKTEETESLHEAAVPVALEHAPAHGKDTHHEASH